MFSLLSWLPVAMANPQLLDLPPRHMWGWFDVPGTPKDASGYCGSVSVQTAGIYFGNWLTEDAIRGTSGGHDAKHSLLLGYAKDIVGEGYPVHQACQDLKMECSMWNYNKEPAPQHERWLAWMKKQIDAGSPVIMGVYWGIEKVDDYAHIVPVVGYDTKANTNTVSAVYFNDLHENYTIREDVSTFVQREAKCRSNNVFGQDAWCLPLKYDYGVAVHGNQDHDDVLLPVRLAMDQWSEPDYSEENKQHETPVMLSATLTISALTPGKHYALLRFEDVALVPGRDFLSAPFADKIEILASATTWSQRVTFMSNSTTMFRCVEMSGAQEQLV